jgi:hypothetical protein
MAYVVFNLRTQCVVLRGTLGQCLSAANTWDRYNPGSFQVRPA